MSQKNRYDVLIINGFEMYVCLQPTKMWQLSFYKRTSTAKDPSIILTLQLQR